MKRTNPALYIAITAMFSALLVGGKQALSAIPNVEVVTIVVALCSYVWGLGVALPAVFVFIAIVSIHKIRSGHHLIPHKLGTIEIGRRRLERQQVIIIILSIHVPIERKLLEVIYAAGTSSAFTGTVERRKQYRRQNGNNGNNNEKFN